MKTRHIVPGIACALLLAPGCARGPEIAGTWAGREALPGTGKAVPSSLVLRPDGTFHYKGASETQYNGTYAVKDDMLTEKITGYSVEGHVSTLPADQQNVLSDTFELKGDTLTLTPPHGGPPSVLKRQAVK